MSFPLHGTIVHRFQPHQSVSDLRVRKCKSRDNFSFDNLGGKEGKLNRRNGELNGEDPFACGFIFLPIDPPSSSDEYLLSLPKSLKKLAYDAVRFQREVVIRRYAEIDLPTGPKSVMIEAHELDVLPIGYQKEINSSSFSDNNIKSDDREEADRIWTLVQFWRKESVDFETIRKSRPKFNIRAKVDAISPIIRMDPSNPFVLIEAFDNDNTDVTCVIVLHGNDAMMNFTAILPSDLIIFRDVVYKKWSIPNVSHHDTEAKRSSKNCLHDHLKGRIPSYVFVATESNCILWVEESQDSVRHGTVIGQNTPEEPIPTTITPVNLVAKIEGRICNTDTVSWKSDHGTVSILKYVDIVLLDETTHRSNETRSSLVKSTPVRCRIFLSHFPMSVALQYSLRNGAILEAHNVHLIAVHPTTEVGFDHGSKICIYYGTCLRSSLAMLKHASDGERRERSSLNSFAKGNLDRYEDEEQRSCLSAKSQFLDHFYHRIDQNYLYDAYDDLIDDWERRSFEQSDIAALGYRETDLKGIIPKQWFKDAIVQLVGIDWIERNTGDASNKTRNVGAQRASKRKQKPPLRNPYAEFFDHPFDFPLADDDRFLNQSSYCGCRLTMQDRICTKSCPFALLDLNSIRIATQRFFEEHISKLLSSNTKPTHRLKKGFHGSIRVSQDELFANDRKREGGRRGSCPDFQESECFVSGLVREVHCVPSCGPATVGDGKCQIPISFVGNHTCCSGMNSFLVARFDSVTIASICLGNFSRESLNDEEIAVAASLPISVSFPVLNANRSKLMSNCSMVLIHGLLFVTSFQVHCRESRVLDTTISTLSDGALDIDAVTSVGYCLLTQAFLSDQIESKTVMGMLTRCRFQCKLRNDGSYDYYRLLVSNAYRADGEQAESDISCLQSVELMLTSKPSTARMLIFNDMLNSIWPGVNLMESQKVSGASFWTLASSGRTCALTFGGNENAMQYSMCRNSMVKVFFPTASLQLTTSGFTRSFCTEGTVGAVFSACELVRSKECVPFSMNNTKPREFDFVGGGHLRTENLPRKPSRRSIFRTNDPFSLPIGELTSSPSKAVPSNSLSDLFDLIYQSIRNPGSSPRIMNPSLVRRISHGHFLGISFCQVQCYCTRCFCQLLGPTVTTAQVDYEDEIRKRKRDATPDEPSFWHLPNPKERLLVSPKTALVENHEDGQLFGHMRSTTLRCPKNGCSYNYFGVKWECSGTLDDGTGQATMYADGDAALTLLGMSIETIQTIEEGIWQSSDGFFQFMRSHPPPKKLRAKVMNALSTLQSNKKNSRTMNPINMLSRQDRAAYLLHQHCRSSSRPRRPLDYYVRCKPLISKHDSSVPHIQHSQIDSYFEDWSSRDENGSATIHRGQVATYALPPLKLQLVDCGVRASDIPSSNESEK